uniref:phosphotransferase n=1 Tax=Hylemonella sp. TaxID=2066020 RepID=UPI0035AD7CFD
MATPAVEPLELFCRRHGVTGPFELQPIRAGRNSQVFLLHNRDGRWVLKHYYQPPGGDRRDRLGVEYGFLEFLKQAGVTGVPVPLGMDRASNLALYSYLPGRRPEVIHSWHISQAAGFILQINRSRATPQAALLPPASDACLGWKAHLDLTESRIARLLSVDPGTGVAREAHDFVTSRLSPLWQKVKIELAARPGRALLQPEDRILSPSDFGFHNTLEHEARLSFVDFEYAGWDDPAKLICDFMCQPELPVTGAQGAQFMRELLQGLPGSEEVEQRVQALLPVHRLKWCCILLNEFRTEDRKRREHAGLASDGLLATQLGKAQWYFDKHLAAWS